MKKQLRQSGYTLCFYHKENDPKLSFFIENEPELTALVMDNVKTKRVKQKDVNCVVKAIDELVFNHSLKPKTGVDMNKFSNPIVALSEMVQAKTGTSLVKTVVEKRGSDHAPIVTAGFILPNGVKCTATAANQKEARKIAAELILEDLESGELKL